MPFKSVKQRKYLYANKPEVAKKFATDSKKNGGRIEKVLKKHSKHHSAKHMKQMRADMKKGMSFSKSHKKAMRKVGK